MVLVSRSNTIHHVGACHGKKVFFVTFRQKDPFYTPNLSNHTVPKAISELEIESFSGYLHPYDGNGDR